MWRNGPLEGTRRVGGLLGVAGRLSGTVSPFRVEQETSLETPWRARAAASVLGILQARRLEWVAVLFSRFPWICHALSCKFLINCHHNNKYDGTLLSRIFFLEESKGLLALVILGQTGEVGAGI